MSLEEALNRNTETMERLILALGQTATIPSGTEVLVTKKEEPSTSVNSAEVVDDRPKRKSKVVKSEPVAEAKQEESSFNESSTPTGAAPANQGSEWYIYTMQLCAQYSAKTGDPAQTQAIVHKHGVMDLSKVDDYKLSQIALEIEPHLGITR